MPDEIDLSPEEEEALERAWQKMEAEPPEEAPQEPSPPPPPA